MWEKGWRQQVWSELDREWDILVIGGGITGAGVFRRAVAEGLKTLLVDASDFSFGTSSRSSKLVHGGIRYLRNRQFGVTREAVHEREWMLREARQLVTPLGCLMPYYQDRHVRDQFALGVVIYDLMAPKWNHSHLSRAGLLNALPCLETPELGGGYLYYDAQVDDSRLVLNLIRQGVRSGGSALSYARVNSLLRNQTGRVCGVRLTDQVSGLPEKEIRARVVINATGPWGDEIRAQVGSAPKLRLLRGSHLIFPRERLPLPFAVTMINPRDHRAMFAIPWEGKSVVGTTDLDHRHPIDQGEPFISGEEIAYILEVTNAIFPGAEIHRGDILSTFSGLRPVINTGKADPSKESRAHVVLQEEGLITVTGGKLTTFRIMAEEALRQAALSLPGKPDFGRRRPFFEPLPELQEVSDLSESTKSTLLGRYGMELSLLLQEAAEGENSTIGESSHLWSEMRYNARHGGVIHLDDLLLRRVRIGLLLPEGGASVMPQVRQIVQAELGWDDVQWEYEAARYRQIHASFYAPNPSGTLNHFSGEVQCQNQNIPHPGMKQESPLEPIALS